MWYSAPHSADSITAVKGAPHIAREHASPAADHDASRPAARLQERDVVPADTRRGARLVELAPPSLPPALLGARSAAIFRDPALILALQRTVGNQAALRFLGLGAATEPSRHEPASPTGHAGRLGGADAAAAHAPAPGKVGDAARGVPTGLATQRTCGCGATGPGGCRCRPSGRNEQDEDDRPASLAVSRQPAPAAPACPLSDPTSVSKSVINSLGKAGGPDIREAFCILNGRAMFDLLPTLLEIAVAGKLAPIESNAAANGGPRMAVAVHAAKLKQAGGKIAGADLDTIIDEMATVNPDQRSDILRFLGFSASITVDGLEITLAYTKGAGTDSCEKEVQDAIDWAKKMQSEYAACGAKKGLKTGNDVENCVQASLAKQGITTTVAGATSSSGSVTITATAMTKCQPILTRGTEIHESEHQAHTLALQKKFGAGTPAFNAAFDSAGDWWRDEVRAYGSEIPFYQKVLAAIAKLQKMKGP